MRIKILKHLKIARKCLFDQFLNEYKNPVDELSRANTSEENADKLRDIINTLIASDSISDETRLSLIYPDSQSKEINEIINHYSIRDTHYNTTIARISNDDKKISLVLGIDTVKNLIYNYEVKNIDSILKEFYIKFGSAKDNFSKLEMDFSFDVVTPRLDKDTFIDSLKQLEPYISAKKNIIEKLFMNNKDVVGYFNYLLSTKGAIDKEVKNDRMTLIKFLNNLDYEIGIEKDNKVIVQNHEILEELVNTDNEATEINNNNYNIEEELEANEILQLIKEDNNGDDSNAFTVEDILNNNDDDFVKNDELLSDEEVSNKKDQFSG